jgi:hypothetical protein
MSRNIIFVLMYHRNKHLDLNNDFLEEWKFYSAAAEQTALT